MKLSETVLLWIAAVLVTPGQAVTIKVVSVLITPFLMRTSDNTNETNPGQYEGYIKDILDSVANSMNVDYTIHILPGQQFGNLHENGSWDGLVGEVLNRNYDLAAAPLTISSRRRKAIQFSIPFQTFGPVIILKKPEPVKKSFQERISRLFIPFEQSVWMMSLICYFGVSTVIYIIARFNPYEWRQMAKDGEATIREAESFNCNNSFWFTISAWMLQGYTRTPRSLGGRLVACFWWIYVIFFLVTFTASLTNLLKTGPKYEEKEEYYKIRGLEDLLKQTEIKYGMFRNGTTAQYFRTAPLPHLHQIYKSISAENNDFVNSIKDGINKVRRKGKKSYAFIMESAMAKYYVRQPPCDIFFVGDGRKTGSYGFGYAKDWKYAHALDETLLELKENGTLHLLEDKWFSGLCPLVTLSPSVRDWVKLPSFESVDLGTFSGALIVLLFGVIAGGIICIFEIIIYKKAEAQPESPESHIILQPHEATNQINAGSPTHQTTTNV